MATSSQQAECGPTCCASAAAEALQKLSKKHRSRAPKAVSCKRLFGRSRRMQLPYAHFTLTAVVLVGPAHRVAVSLDRLATYCIPKPCRVDRAKAGLDTKTLRHLQRPR